MTSTTRPVGAAPSGKVPAPATGAAPPKGSDPSNGFLAKAALVTAVLTVAGAVLGLGRDQALAHFFGAGSETDAFLVAWTVPEVATTLLIEDGLAFALVPAFSVALARRRGAREDPVRALVAATLPRLSLAFAGVGLVLMAKAPHLVELLAPGLPAPRLAVDCTRLTATCVLSFGLAGYCSAVLRAHRRFVAPAAIYVAYNVGIIGTVLVLDGRGGVRSAALGVAIGGVLMVAVQAPSLWWQLRRRAAQAPSGTATDEASAARLMSGALIATVLLFALCRQSQVLIERFFASSLPAGAISHLNYAQKVAQVPMILSLMLCTVTLPVVAQALAEGDVKRARSRVERDLGLASCIVLLGTAVVIACAPQIIQLLFQRGAFTPADTAATTAVMRVYALGLIGHTLVGALVRSYFSGHRVTWYPLGAMAVGVAATAAIGSRAVDLWGVRGIALANAAGISITAVVLLCGMGPRSVPIRVRRVLAELAKPAAAAVCATGFGAAVALRFASPLVGVAAGSLTVAGVFALVLWVLRAKACKPVARSIRSVVRSVTRKRSHGR
ncbi:murein biosynthesis integral membrane protein MurJ [Streptomyces sp. NPDC059037]|uniref:murein biosynthesis integral membrane protein MurJ n=1 Tax=Streptomyces sp. NPDC059037 TaxID=3346710 RepID=UPI00369DDC6E